MFFPENFSIICIHKMKCFAPNRSSERRLYLSIVHISYLNNEPPISKSSVKSQNRAFTVPYYLAKCGGGAPPNIWGFGPLQNQRAPGKQQNLMLLKLLCARDSLFSFSFFLKIKNLSVTKEGS